MPFISVVTPVYKCAASIEELFSRLSLVLPRIDGNYEIIFVIDGNPDNAQELITHFAKK